MLSLLAAVSASVIVGAIVVQATATPQPTTTSTADSATSTHTPAATPSGGSATAPGGSNPTASATSAGTETSAIADGPPRPGRYSYDAPGGKTVTTVVVHPTGPGTWEVDESIATRSGVVQSRRETWTSAGVRVLGVWEASQPQPCVWSNAPVDVVFPLRAGSTWSVGASCRVSHGASGAETTQVQGSFRVTERTTLTIAGRTVDAWLVVGNEITTSDGAVNGHRYHTVDRTTTRVWFVPSVGLPGRTELTGTVVITSYKGTVRHPISQLTQLESLSPQ